MKKNLVFTALALATVLTISGCQKDNTKLEILFEDAVPNCIMGEEYDFGDILIQQDGVHYDMDAYYQNYYTKQEFEIETNGLKFTQNEQFDVSVVVTATKGSQKKTRTQLVQCSVAADPIDELLNTNGFSGFSDTGVTKELVTDEQYLKDGGKTALAVYYQGNNSYPWGAAVLNPSNFRCLDYWTDKTWEDTILKFWAYNPTEYDIEFQLRVKDAYTGLVDIDWGNTMNIIQYAKAGEWTEILFPLHRIGVDHTLYINESGSRNDSLTVKMRWLGTPAEDPTPLYSYQLFIDGVDMVPASEYPEIDTTCYAKAEKASDSLENMMFDSGWQRSNSRYDRNVVRTAEYSKSKSSLWCTFEGISSNDTGYSVIYNVGSSVHDGEIEDYPNLSHGVLKADFKFSSNITDYRINMIVTDESWVVVKKVFDTTDLGDGWRRLEIDMSPNDEFIRYVQPIRIGFGFVGVTESNKSTAEVHMDNFFYEQNAGSPAKPELETYQEGLENLLIDSGFSGCTYSYDNTTVNTIANPDSRYSIKLGFNVTAISLGYGVTFSPESQGLSGASALSCDGCKIEFDVKFSSGITDHTVKGVFVCSDWKALENIVSISPVGEANADGWYHYSLDMDANTTINYITELIRIGVYFPGVSKLNKTTANVWVDNMFITPIA